MKQWRSSISSSTHAKFIIRCCEMCLSAARTSLENKNDNVTMVLPRWQTRKTLKIHYYYKRLTPFATFTARVTWHNLRPIRLMFYFAALEIPLPPLRYYFISFFPKTRTHSLAKRCFRAISFVFFLFSDFSHSRTQVRRSYIYDVIPYGDGRVVVVSRFARTMTSAICEQYSIYWYITTGFICSLTLRVRNCR